MKVKFAIAGLFTVLLLLTGCDSEKEDIKGVDHDATEAVTKKTTEDTPSFVKEADFKEINWDKIVTKIGTNGPSDIIGNPNTVGYIGPNLQTEKVEKWLWHFFGKPHGYLAIIAYHQDTSIKVPLLTSGYKSEFASGAMNGADATMPSNVSLPKAGKWALLVYIDEELYDTLVINVEEIIK